MRAIFKSSRNILLATGLLLTTTAILLVGTLSTSVTLFIEDDLQTYWRTTYDILIRPPHTQSPIERKYGLIEANYLSQVKGGISFEQYQTIATLPDIDVAAPVALLTYIQEDLSFAARFPNPDADGMYLHESILTLGDGINAQEELSTIYYYLGPPPSIQEDVPGIYVNQPIYSHGYPVSLLLAAIDPVQEAKLINLDQAIEKGNYLTGDEPVFSDMFSGPSGNTPRVSNVPILINATPYVSFTLLNRLSQILLPTGVSTFEDVLNNGGVDYLTTLPTETIIEQKVDSNEAFSKLVDNYWNPGSSGGLVQYHNLRSSSLPVSRQYQEVAPPFAYDGQVLGIVPPPLPEGDAAMSGTVFNLKAYGVFNIEKIPPPPDVNRVPLEIYYPPVVTLRYDEQGQPVTSQPLQPTLEPRSYVLSPPLMLTTLEAARAISGNDCTHCISAIRVRVAGIDEFTPAAQRKIETIAGEIARQTSLDVDIMVGSSPTPVLVRVPGVGYVEEQWIQKNVTYTYQKRVQKGHLLLLGTLLGIGGLFVLDLAWAEVAARRRTIALQKALGWRSATVFSQVLGQIMLVGVLAALLGTLAAVGITWLAGWPPPSLSLLVGVPLLIVGLCLVGGAYPAWLAAHIPPIVGLQQGVIRSDSPKRLQRPTRSLWRFAWRGLSRRWSRSVLGGLTAALSAALLTLMLAVTVDRQGAMSGTLLGEFILVKIEGFHYAIVGIGFGLAAFSLANSLLAGVVERRREIGVLKAVGWQTGAVARLFLMEGVWLGALGGLLGTAVGLSIFVALYESVSANLGWVGLAGVLMPTLVGALAALYPARVASHAPPAEAVRYE